MSEYTCNAILKRGATTSFCGLGLGHLGHHRDGDVTWAEPAWDNDFDV